MYGHRERISSVPPDQKYIPCKNKIKKTSDNLIKGKESIQESDNRSKRAKKDTIPDVEKGSKKTPPSFKHKED